MLTTDQLPARMGRTDRRQQSRSLGAFSIHSGLPYTIFIDWSDNRQREKISHLYDETTCIHSIFGSMVVPLKSE